MKVAVIGCGNIANNAHIPAYLKNGQAEIKYFCDILPERAQEAVRKYGCGIAVTDYREILADAEVVAVSVCVPNKLHRQIACDFLRAGKHVLCEKPAAVNLEEALEMQKVQHQTGKILNIGVVNRFNDYVNAIKDLIDSGALGEIFHVHTSFRNHRSIPGLGGDFTTKAVAGGGVLIDWGVHFLDIVMYCCGDPVPHTVSAAAFSKLGCDIAGYVYDDMWAGPPQTDGTYDVEDSVTALIRTDGPIISVHGAWAQNIGKNEMYIDFCGDKGGIRLQYGREFTVYTVKDGKLYEYTPSVKANNHFENEINAFVDCVQTGKKLPSHIDNAIITARIMQAIYDSAEARMEVTV